MKQLFYFLFAALIFVSSCKKDDGTDNPTIPATYKVTYSIACSDCQVIYYKDSLEAQQSMDHQNSTWTYTFYGKKNQSVLLFAYNQSNNPQGVTARIAINDSIVQEATNYCPISGYSFVEDTIR